MDDAAIRKRCEEWASKQGLMEYDFVGNGGWEHTGALFELVKAAFSDGRRAGLEEAAKMAEEKAERSIKGEHLNIPEYNFGYRGGLRGLADEIRLKLYAKAQEVG